MNSQRSTVVSEPVRMVAVDLGASSGRVALGTLTSERLELEVLHRFENAPVTVQGRLYWDVLYLWSEICKGLKIAGTKGNILSLGVDSWAVDYALLSDQDHLLDGVRCYRDERTEGVMERAFEVISKEEIYRHTGLQFLSFNTLYQLLATRQEAPSLLKGTKRLLMVPDLLHFWLSGRQVCEATNASTTQFFDPMKRDWSEELLEKFGLSADILPEIVPPGTVLGLLRDDVAGMTGLEGTLVVAPGTHDTASAVAAVPAEGDAWAYLSSGTWSLLGVERPEPLLSEAARRANFTNEGGVFGTVRFLKNVMGLWILQVCVRSWEADLTTLLERLSSTPSFEQFIDPDDARFLYPGSDMPRRVQDFCRETGQKIPENELQITRCILESLALKYSLITDQLRELSAQPIDVLYIVGGGSNNRVLSQWTADACRCRVICGPNEATLYGNLLV